jgi:hypothetical protein
LPTIREQDELVTDAQEFADVKQLLLAAKGVNGSSRGVIGSKAWCRRQEKRPFQLEIPIDNVTVERRRTS